MFAVYDGEMPASCVGFECGWENHKFVTKEEAYAYADKWLGGFGPMPRAATRFEYGYGISVEIKEED